jgi:leucine carboxyl methyltransferase
MHCSTIRSPRASRASAAYESPEPCGAWVVAIRTVLIDAFIGSAISSGIDTVISLGAGMDTRPYRMDLSASLHWVEVDHPSLIESKNAQLSTELPGVFDRTGRSGPGRPPRPPATLRPDLGHLNESDGPHGRVLGALSADEAGGLADDLRDRPGCESWVIDDFSARLSRRIGSTSRIPMSRSVSIHPAGRRSSPNTAGVPRRSVSLGGVRTLHRPVPLSRLDKVMPLFTSRPLRGHGRASGGSDEGSP